MKRNFQIAVLMALTMAIAGITALCNWGEIELKAKLFFNRPEFPFRPENEAHLPDYVDAGFWAGRHLALHDDSNPALVSGLGY